MAMAVNDPNSEPYEKGKPNPIDLVSDLSPLAVLAYTHHMILAAGELWSAFVDSVGGDGDEAPEWMREAPRAISVIADGWLEMQETVGVNWNAGVSDGETETATSDTSGS